MSSVGQATSRVEGPLKVAGEARYTADIRIEGAAHAAIVPSLIANGRTVSVDASAAQQAPGVVAVFTWRNMPRLNPTPKPWSHLHPHGQGYLPLQDDSIHYAGQPIALVVAATLAQATHAATLIRVEYEEEKPLVFGPDAVDEAFDPPQFLWPVNSSVGDADKGLAAAAVKIEQTYTTADRHHNQMEPHASTAIWGPDGSLTLYETTQHIFGARELAAIVLGVPPEKITVVSKFVGGGFGGKAYVWPHTLMAAAAAKQIGRAVRLQLTRANMYSMVGRQAATRQTISLGADQTGRLTGIRHESISPTSVFDNYIEYAALGTRSLWPATDGVSTKHRIVRVNHNTPTAMRSPHEALGHFALESAMDELAYATATDPVALRLLNDTQIDPHSGRPFSTRALGECLTQGAARFGWDRRSPEPRSMRDGGILIGQGVAAAIYTHWRWPSKARVTLRSDGTALVEVGSHEIGGGTYTVMRQIAADVLGMALDRVTVTLGDTRLPASHASIGSATMANAGASVMLAARAARDKAIELALRGRDAPLAGAAAEDVVVTDGVLSAAPTNVSATYAELMTRNGLQSLEGEGNYDPVEEANGPKAIFSFSAVFAEVRVDPDFGTVRVSRLLGAYDAGRIINPKTARSQGVGGMIWGVGQALLEQSETDPRMGRFVNRNLSGYLVPANADIPELDVLFVERFDDEASPLGAKGLGELTAVSVAPAIVNAVYHATGKRIRDLPVTIEKLM
ncbi:MAG TPA: xanthine dehydrogenase family protein molybdopterin-binding subunit [Caulobacteraceae bacterium]|jgi:xanthine dehydrogenase YagR molybdenum-binding subunit